ncbi:MAG: hypothetical protein HYZ34_00785, partial [Ignavibacteriae bacterium]|nr:hypothetical protein [Ignavibacteriota bacterium]
MKRLIQLLLLGILLISCSKKESEILRVSTVISNKTVTQDEPLRFTFSKAVVPVESVSVWMNTPFVRFTPEIAGKFIWQDTSTLLFSPDEPLKGDTRYEAKLNTALLLQYSGMKSFEGDDNFGFATESFRLASAEFFYDRLGEQRKVGIKANLECTYSVNPEDVSKYLKLKIDNEL